MVMEVHGVFGHDMDRLIRSVFVFFTIDDHEVIYPCLFVNIAFQHVLTSAIERKIALAGDACSRPPTNTKPYDLHADDTRAVMGEIVSCHERD